MGKSDTAVNIWLGDKARFADLFNASLFNGEQIIMPEELEVIKGEAKMIVTDKDDRQKDVKKYRDIVMRWKGEADLAVLACESQDKVHYAMPVRVMMYDALSYSEQIAAIKKEYLAKKEKLGQEGYLQTDMQLVLGMLQYRNKKAELRKYVEEHQDSFEKIDENTYNAIVALLNADKQLKEIRAKKGEVNMCKALEELYQDGVREGIEKGIQTGIERGIQTGIERGIKATVELCQEFGLSREIATEKIKEKYELEDAKAREYIKEYWK